MENVLLDYKNRLFVQDFPAWEKVCNTDYFVDEKCTEKQYDNAIVLPALVKEDLKGGVCSENFDFITGLFREVKDGKVVNRWATISQSYVPTEEIEYCDQEVVFGGVLISQFGHMLVDGLSRMWWHVEHQDSKLPFAFITTKGPMQQYYYKTFELLGIERNRIRIITKPTKFRSIIVPEEAVHSMSRYKQQWLSTFDLLARNALELHKDEKLPEKIYLTKSKYKDKCMRIFNEEYFENFYHSLGYEIIAPEQYPLDYQIALAANAKAIATTLGTIAHFNLFAKDGLKIDVLTRTKETYPVHTLTFQAKHNDWNIIDPSYNFLLYNLAWGDHLLKPNLCWVNYVNKRFGIQVDESPINNDMFREYVEKWTEFYCDGAKHFRNLKFDRFDAFDVLNILATTLFDRRLNPKDYRTMPTKQEMQKSLAEKDKVIAQLNSNVSQKDKKIKDTEKKLVDKTNELKSIKNSFSFKLGRFLTFFPRKIKRLFTKNKHK